MIGTRGDRRKALSAGLAALLLVAAAPVRPAPRALPRDFQRGVCYAHLHSPGYGYGSARSRETLLRLRALGVDCVSITPFGYMHGVTWPHVRMPRDPSLGDSLLLRELATIRGLGMRALLKPHLWSRDFYRGRWTGEIAMGSAADWNSWFAEYGRFLLHYAEIAERGRADALCIGNELGAATRERPEDFRRLIEQVRRVFHGKLTYAANWHDEFERIAFWDALDWIGVNAYFDLSRAGTPTVGEIEQAWGPVAGRMHRLSVRWKRPVVLTEVGFRSVSHPATRTYSWQEFDLDGRPDLEAQRACYEGTFRALWGRPWLLGLYWWKWYTSAEGEDEGTTLDFTPEGKPAERVLARYYRRGAFGERPLDTRGPETDHGKRTGTGYRTEGQTKGGP
jgi:Glycoside Hydrolase Family 113